MTKQRKAVSLISGGLDSMLATKVIMEQGIHVEGINFFTGFCVEGHTHAIRKRDKAKPKRNNALWVAEQLGIKMHIVDVIEEYKDVLLNPRHGYGQNMNPCLDCKGFMVKKALEWIQQNDFDFIITGEVIGQRPMSQRKDTMPVIARESGAGDRLDPGIGGDQPEIEFPLAKAPHIVDARFRQAGRRAVEAPPIHVERQERALVAHGRRQGEGLAAGAGAEVHHQPARVDELRHQLTPLVLHLEQRPLEQGLPSTFARRSSTSPARARRVGAHGMSSAASCS